MTYTATHIILFIRNINPLEMFNFKAMVFKSLILYVKSCFIKWYSRLKKQYYFENIFRRFVFSFTLLLVVCIYYVILTIKKLQYDFTKCIKSYFIEYYH